MGHTRSPWVAMFCHLAHPRAAVPAMAALLWLPNNVRGWESSPLPNTLMVSMSMQAFCLLMTAIFLYIFMICSCDFPSFVHICVILYSSIRERIHTREVHGVLSHSYKQLKPWFMWPVTLHLGQGCMSQLPMTYHKKKSAKNCFRNKTS